MDIIKCQNQSFNFLIIIIIIKEIDATDIMLNLANKQLLLLLLLLFIKT